VFTESRTGSDGLHPPSVVALFSIIGGQPGGRAAAARNDPGNAWADGLVMALREGQAGPERERVLSSLALRTFRLVILIRLVHGLLWQLALPESVKLLSPLLMNCQL
jgi:hypothetical protein